MGFCCVPLFSAVPIENHEQRFQFYMTFLKPLGPNQKLFPARQNTYIFIFLIFRWTFFNLQTNLSEIERRVAFNY